MNHGERALDFSIRMGTLSALPRSEYGGPEVTPKRAMKRTGLLVASFACVEEPPSGTRRLSQR